MYSGPTGQRLGGVVVAVGSAQLPRESEGTRLGDAVSPVLQPSPATEPMGGCLSCVTLAADGAARG